MSADQTSLAPGESALLCAVCGPISDEEVRAVGIVLRDEEGVLRQRRRALALLHPPWTELAARYRQSGTVRQAAARIESLRASAERSGGSPPRGEALLVARARQALLDERQSDFARHFARYLALPSYRSPKLHEADFWSGVLGPGLEGSELVHSRPARQRIAAHIALNFAFSAMPAQCCLSDKAALSGTTEAGDSDCELSIVEALRTGDLDTLRRLSGREPDGLAAAALHLLRGQLAEAHRLFAENLPARREEVSANPAHLPLRLHAIIAALGAGAPSELCRLQIELAYYSIDRVLDLSQNGARDYISLLDNLAWLESARRRSGKQLPRSRGGVSLIPILWGFACLPDDVRHGMPTDKLAARLGALAAAGQPAMAAHGAAALRRLLPPEAPEQNLLRPLCTALPGLSPIGSISLTAGSEDGEDGEDSDDEAIAHVLPGLPAGQLYWDLRLAPGGASINRITLRLSSDAQDAGRTLDLSPHRLSAVTALMDADDRRRMPLLRELSSSAGRQLDMAASLAGHPRLRLEHDTPSGPALSPVQLRASRPKLRVIRRGSGVELKPDIRLNPGLILKRSEGEIELSATGARQKRFCDEVLSHGSRGSLRLEKPDPLELQELLNSLADSFDLSGKLLPDDAPRQKAEPELSLEADYRDGTLSLRPRLKLLPDALGSVEAGQGPSRMLIATKRGPIGVTRNLSSERRLIRQLEQRCPALAAEQPNNPPYNGTQISDPARQIELLRQLKNADLPVHFTSAQSLQLIDTADLALDIRSKQGESWLSIGGQLRVDEHKVIELSALLKHPSTAPRSGDKQLLCTPELQQALNCLRQLARLSPAQQLRLSRAALPALCDLFPEQSDTLMQALQQSRQSLAEARSAPPPNGLAATLRPYQLEGYRWLLERTRLGIGACLADDMGLGKTIQTLALLLERADGGPALIIAPLSLLGNWEAEAARFAPGLRTLNLRDIGTERAPQDLRRTLVLASYGQVSARPESAGGQHWHTLVLDEAQNIRNPGTKRARSLFTLQADARLCLSGTPVENRLLDLWSLMHFLNPELLGSERDFKLRYGHGERLDELHRITAPLILRRTRRQVLPQLPPLTDITLPVTLGREERALYESCRRRALERSHRQRGTLFAELTRLRRLCCHGSLVAPDYQGPSAKTDALIELVESLRDAGHQALIFSQFTDVLDIVAQHLDPLGISYLRLDGRTGTAQRSELVERFQAGEAQLFLISLGVGGTGLNLTAAGDVILLDPWWNPTTEQQAASRAHRLGQRRPVTLYRLYVKDSVEERILALQEQKQQLADTLIGEGSLPLETLLSLLSD